jgi:hypothetical protein
VVVFGVGVGEQVVADADLLLRLQEAAMVLLKNLARGGALLVGGDEDGCPVRV